MTSQRCPAVAVWLCVWFACARSSAVDAQSLEALPVGALTACAEICAPAGGQATVEEDCVDRCETLLVGGRTMVVETQPRGDQERGGGEDGDWTSSSLDEQGEQTQKKRAPSSFIRIGRQVRRTYFGKRGDDVDDDMERMMPQSSELQAVRSRSIPSEAAKRSASSFVRIGRQLQQQQQQRGAVAGGDGRSKRYSSFVRIGRTLVYPVGGDQQQQSLLAPPSQRTTLPLRRASAPEFIRFGKDLEVAGEDSVASAAAKRGPSSFVRIGRAAAAPK